MIDCCVVENQARRQTNNNNSMILHQPQMQTQQQPAAIATYRPLQAASNSMLIDVPTTNQQATSNVSSGNSNNTNNELIGYYFGSISRETADWILRNHGNQMDGAYLLRSSGPNDDFVLSLMVVTTLPNNSSITCQQQQQLASNGTTCPPPVSQHTEVLHYKIVETEDSFVALHGQVGDEKFATIDELIDKAQGVASKPRWPIQRQSLESQILPPTYWGLSVYQVCLAFFIKAKQWGFPLLPSLFQPPQQQQPSDQQQQITLETVGPNAQVTTLSIETMRTLIYKSLHEFQPWFHGKISREDAERRIEDGPTRDGKFLVRERDNYSYAMCICHRRATKHYRIDVLPTGELAIQDGRKFTSLMALVSHYTIMSDGLWCALTEPCPRPIQPLPAGPPPPAQATANGFSSIDTFQPPVSTMQQQQQQQQHRSLQYAAPNGGQQNLYCMPPPPPPLLSSMNINMMAPPMINGAAYRQSQANQPQVHESMHNSCAPSSKNSLACAHPIGSVTSIKAPIKEWLQTINQKWSQLMAAKSQHQSLNSFLFGSQNPLNNHCRHNSRGRHHHSRQHNERRRTDKTGSRNCGCYAHQHQQQQQHHHHQQHQLQLQLQHQNQAATLARNFAGQPLDQHHSQSTRLMPANDRALACPPAAAKFIPPPQYLPPGADQAPPTLLNSLPQSSGFQLNGQSFVGSPLFAVRAGQKQTGPGSQAGSSNSGSNIVEQDENEEKLISPAQSISANLNQQQQQQQSHHQSVYNNNNDIYGSQPSTAIVNDKHMLTSSSSSSGTINNRHNQNYLANGSSSKTFQQQQAIANACAAELLQRQAAAAAANYRPAVPTGGHIMCGQHAGPAYRYTNCQNDENDSSRACPHLKPQLAASFARPLTRAYDDSQIQLGEPNSQLLGPAALSKFVQFQDGQCLRTHRDTRSIQMAYLSSQRAQLRQANNQPLGAATNGLARFTAGGQQQVANSTNLTTQSNKFNGSGSNQAPPSADIDLMDCGWGQNDFKVDPKLIKSSSIETLCGAADEEDDEQLDQVLSSCKSNAELLQAFIKLNSSSPFDSNGSDNILKPIQMNTMMVDSTAAVRERHEVGQQQTLLSSLHQATSKDNREKLDYLNKRHNLDELYTALFAELDASLKAQVDLKNKCLGSGSTKDQMKFRQEQPDANGGKQPQERELDTTELIYEFDSLIPNNQR